MKTITTEPLYQSTFLPKISSAENEIKKLIVYYFLHFKPKNELRARINDVVAKLNKSLPANVLNKWAYLNGLLQRSEKMIRQYYDNAVALFLTNAALVKTTLYQQGERIPFINNPIELQNIVKKYPLSMWEQAKGTPNYIPSYSTQVKQFIKKVADEPITAEDGTSKGISIWQKAELDIRHEHQMKMWDDLVSNGVEYAYISSHPDCSKRCEKWQGKLVSLTKHSTMSGFRVEKLDGQWVYSLPDITSQVDKYGYHNNIISGFNCFDKETEVLTNNGWKLFKDLQEEDLIYTLNPKTRISEWQKPINYFKNWHNGKMIHFKSFISDLMTTPNHNMLYYTQFNKELRFEEANKVKKTHFQYAGQEWVGNDTKEIVVGDKKVKAPLFCRLLGYWLADGSIQDYNSIKIAQQHNDPMWESLQELPFKLWRDENKIIVRDSALHDMLKPLGTCTTKYIFKWVKELSKECLTELLNAFNYTDGYTTKTTKIGKYERKPHKTVFTTSKQMADDLCEIALKVGYRPKMDIRKDKGKEVKFKNGIYTINNDMYVIHLNYHTSFGYKTIEEEEYNDFVYCVEVPNHTLLVKRNGFIQWCGNCRHRLIEYTGQLPPKEYSEVDIKKQRHIEAQIRAKEREIRKLKTEYKTIKLDPSKQQLARNLESKINKLINEYYSFCEKQGYSSEKWRLG